MKKYAALIFAFLTSLNSFAQTEPPRRSPLDPANWGVVYDVPATKNVNVKKNVIFMKSGERNLGIDIYTPPNAKANEKVPAVIFLNSIGDLPGNEVKEWGIYSSFPRLIAAHGMAGISMNADGARIPETLQGLFDFLEKDGAKYGIDGTRLGVYAASANVGQSTVYLMSERASKGIRAAALFYGNAPTPNTKIRKDLPVLFILPEGDFVRANQPQMTIWQQVAEARAPWTLVFANNLPHAFDAFTDNDDARRVIQQAIAFWKTHLEPVPQPDWKPSEARAIVEATYWNDHKRVEQLLTKYLADNPSEVQGFIYLGRALLNQQKLVESAAAFEKALKLEPGSMAALSGFGQVLLAQKRYEDAISMLSKAVDAGSRSPQIFNQIALAQTNLNRFDEAIETYQKSRQAGMNEGIAYYNMACVYSLSNRADKAFEFLNKAIDAGYRNRNQFETDADLNSIRGDARFQDVLKRLPSAASL